MSITTTTDPVAQDGVLLPAAAVPIWADSPAMDRVREAAKNRLPFVDVAVSGGARAFVVAGLAEEENRASAQAGRPSRPILLVTATTREAEDLAEALGCLFPRDRVATSRAGRPCRTSGSARAATPSVDGSPCCGGSATPTPTTRRTGRCRVVVAPGARRPPAGGPRARRPGAGRPEGRGRGAPGATSSRPWPPRPTPAPTSSSAAASSPCAAASSTSSRRPRSTRCGSSSGATRSRRSAGSRSPTSAASRSPSTACGRRRAARCCSPTPCARAPRQLADAAARRRRPAGQARRGHRRRGHGVARAGPRRRHGERPRPAARRRRWSCSCDPERVRTRAHDLVATSQEFLEAGWANAAAGNAVPVDLQGVLGTASFWTLADLRGTRRSRRACRGGTLGPFVADEELAERRLGRSSTPVARRRRRATAADPEAAVARPAALGRRRLARRRRHRGPGLARRVAEVLGEHESSRPGSTPT